MPSYKTQPPLSLKKTEIIEPVEPAVDAEPAKEEIVSIRQVSSMGREALHDAIRAHRNRAEDQGKVTVVPPLSDRTLREMKQGRDVSERHAAKMEAMKQVPASKDGYTVPVYRPADHVPGFDSKDLGARNLK